MSPHLPAAHYARDYFNDPVTTITPSTSSQAAEGGKQKEELLHRTHMVTALAAATVGSTIEWSVRQVPRSEQQLLTTTR